MAKESVWQRRARKRGSAKAEYYPKVDLADEMGGLDPLARVEALAVVEVQTTADPQEEPAEPTAFDLAAAEPLEAANDVGEPQAEPTASESLELSEPAPIEAAAPAMEAPEAAPAEPTEGAEAAQAAPPATGRSIQLAQFLDLPAAKPLAATLLERRGQPIVLDGSQVSQLGAQCVQVLLSAKRTWSADGVPLSIVNCAPRMIEDLQFLGIDSATLISGDLTQ